MRYWHIAVKYGDVETVGRQIAMRHGLPLYIGQPDDDGLIGIFWSEPGLDAPPNDFISETQRLDEVIDTVGREAAEDQQRHFDLLAERALNPEPVHYSCFICLMRLATARDALRHYAFHIRNQYVIGFHTRESNACDPRCPPWPLDQAAFLPACYRCGHDNGAHGDDGCAKLDTMVRPLTEAARQAPLGCQCAGYVLPPTVDLKMLEGSREQPDPEGG